MLLRDAMRKAASLIVELPPEPSRSLDSRSGDIDLDDLPDTDLPDNARLPGDVREPVTVEQLVQNADGPNLDQIEINEEPPDALTEDAAGQGALDFGAIYAAAKLPATQFGADEMLGVLSSMPSDVPLQTKRVTVKAVLGGMASMGASPENIVADASRKLAALQAFHSFMERKTGETIETGQREIAQLEAQIEERRLAMQSARGELARVTQGCEAQADRLDDVLEFFSLDEGASKHAGDRNQLSGVSS